VGRPLPIACSLPAGDQAKRLEEMSSLSARLLSVERDGGRGPVLRFEHDADTESRVSGIVAAERECCPFLDLSLRSEGSELCLSISGPEEAEPVIAGIVDALTGA
jgi:MerR family transcriptional regulator, copper efflux regulator